VKPALLYADVVTIHSPAAWMLREVERFASLAHPRDRVAAVIQIAQQVPAIAQELPAIDPDFAQQIETFLGLDRSLVKRVANLAGHRREVEALYRSLDDFADSWDEQMSLAMLALQESVGSSELRRAIDAKVLRVADIAPVSSTSVVANAARLATGHDAVDHIDELVINFVARIVDVVYNPSAFPLLDAQTSGLIRALEDIKIQGPRGVTMKRAGEIAAAARFMGFLPAFPNLPMDEILDLRKELRVPLGRFRSAMIELATTFANRPIDDDFDLEIDESWRATVEPALRDIRETLAEHRFLTEVASVASGDPRRIMLEAGGVVATARANVISLSGLMATALATALPVADIAIRAAKSAADERRTTRKQGFFFLHQLQLEAERRTSAS